jgi:hypothetical protein
MIVIGFVSLAGILLAEALLQWKFLGTDNKAGNAACVLFIFLYILFFQVRAIDLLLMFEAETFIVCGCAIFHLGCRGLPNPSASQGHQSGNIRSLCWDNHVHGTITVGIQEYVSPKTMRRCFCC